MKQNNISLMKQLKEKIQDFDKIRPKIFSQQNQKQDNIQILKSLQQQSQNHIINQQNKNNIEEFEEYQSQIQDQTYSKNNTEKNNDYQQEEQIQKELEHDTFNNMIKDIQRKKKIQKKNITNNKINIYSDVNNVDQDMQIQKEDQFDYETLRNLYNIKIKTHSNINIPIVQELLQSKCYKIVKKQFQENFQFQNLTPVQMQIIPLALMWSDIICTAPTGSGKTLAYLIPILNFLITLPKIKKTKWHLGPYSLILVPSRELALQIKEVFQQLSTGLEITCQCIVGGHQIQKQSSMLLYGSELIIATVGRFKDLLYTNRISLQQCYQIVIDEVDKMMDYQEELLYIFQHLNLDKMKKGNLTQVRYQEDQCVKGDDLYIQLMTFSATLPEEQSKIIQQFTQYAYQIDIQKSELSQLSDKVIYEFEYLGLKDTFSEKVKLLNQYTKNEKKKIVVFFNTKISIERIEKYYSKNKNIYNLNFVVFYGDLTQQKREENLQKFRNDVDVLFTTDLGGRGLDIDNLNTVINFDLPTDIEKFTHRSGRTGRGQNKHGKVISFVGNNDSGLYKDLIDYLKSKRQKIPQFMTVLKVFDTHVLD